MATKYSDFIRLQNFLPVYDIQNDDDVSWQSFIPTRQFEDLLRRSLSAITSSEASKRKGVWVRGTFGTGKSHASAVVKHLLCDDSSQISAYVESIQNVALKNQLRGVRGKKRYFPVTLKGVEKAYDIPRFTLSLQREVKRALEAVAPDFVVKSDFQIARSWIERHRRIFEEDVFAKDDDLRQYYDEPEQVLSRLDAGDTSAYLSVEEAIRRNVGSVLDHTGISDWLVEVEGEMERRGIADGLIIFWDEFTSVMDTLKSDRINVLQNIAEKSQSANVFLFLISHRTELQSSDTRGKDITRMSDRFDDIQYSMDTLSTYLIMRHSFTIENGEKNAAYNAALAKVSAKIDPLIDFLTDNNADQKAHVRRLFPMHPYTAYLSSEISNFIGSSNRSVIKFMHDDKTGFEAFLNNESAYESEMMMTAETLWDFFFDAFVEDLQSTSFTSLFKSYEGKVRASGEDHLRVFKAILLLNALAPKFTGDMEKMTPDDDVISKIFKGDRIESRLTDILNFLDDNKVVARNIFGQFKITGNAYNQSELDQQKAKARSSYKMSADVLSYNEAAKRELSRLFIVGETVKRETVVQFFSCEESDQLVRSRLDKFMQDKPNYVHVAIFLSIDEGVRAGKELLLRDCSVDQGNLAIVLPDETFSQSSYHKFIDAIATGAVAKLHFQNGEAQECEREGRKRVEKWVSQLLRNGYSLFHNGDRLNEGVVEQLPLLLNDKLSRRMFAEGFERVNYFKAPMTFFGDKNCPKVIEQILKAQQRDELITFGGSQIPIKWIFEENGNSLVTLSGELSEGARAGNSWLVAVCRRVDVCVEEARKKYADKFYLSDMLEPFLHAPFGMFSSFANCAALSFALRRHKGDLFLPQISQPVSDEKLTDMLVELFKMWKEGRSERKATLTLRFGSPEEGLLSKLFVDLFRLDRMPGVKASEIKSLDIARWYVQEFCKTVAKQPLWTLLHLRGLSADLGGAVGQMIKLFEQDSPSVEAIKSIYNALYREREELAELLTKADNYGRGFEAFVEGISEAPIKREWWEEMLAAVDTLPSEIAFRRESDVRQKIVEFYIKKIEITPSPPPTPPTPPGPPPPPVNPGVVDEARKKIKSLNMPNMMWQRLALDMLEAHPELASFFNKV